MPGNEEKALTDTNGEVDADHQQKVNQLIASTLENFRVELKLIYDARLNEQENRLKEQGERIESMEMDIALMKEKRDDEMKKLRLENDALKDNLHAMRQSIITIERKANDNEQYTRRNNLRFRGVSVAAWESVPRAIIRVVNNMLNVGVDENGQRPILTEADIEAAHYVRPKQPPNSVHRPTAAAAPSSHPSTADEPNSSQPSSTPSIIVRFLNRSWRDRIIKARKQLKNKRLVISEDLSPANHKLLNQLKSIESVDNAWSWNGKLYYALPGVKKPHPIQIHDALPN